MQARFTLAVLLGVVLLAAGACSGGGDDERIAELETDLEASEEARETAEREAAEAKQRADDAEDETADAEQRADAAEEEIADAEEEIADAEEEIADAKELQQTAEQGQRQAQQQQQQLQQQLTEAEQAELRARATSFNTQLSTPEPGSATVEWTRGSILTFRPAGITTTRGSAAPSVPGGWRSASFTGQTGTAATLTDETIYLYTNIMDPSSRAFWKVHNVEVGVPTALAASTLNADDNEFDPTPTAAARVVRVGPDLDYAVDSTYNIAVAGTYDGVAGTYTCATCAIEDGDDDDNDITAADFSSDAFVMLAAGERSFVNNTSWAFKPGSITSRVKAEDQADQDDAFLYFGVWSSIPDNINGDTYNFRYVAGGGAESGTDVDNFDQLIGPATFRGGAVGRYVTRGQVGGQNAKIGTFTATATLNAHFGVADPLTAGTLSGSITDFREDGSPLAGWRVTLGGGGSPANVGMPVEISLADNADDASGITVANIGGLSVAGTWGANFYGHDNEVLSDRTKYPATRYPVVDLAGVAGWFNAAGDDPNDASLAGAFAATRSN